jgi:hypothetical protein
MIAEDVKQLMRALIGNQVLRVLVGPAGVHFDVGLPATGSAPEVRYGFFADTRITLHAKGGHLILQTAPFPPYSCEDVLRQHLVGRTITNSTFNRKLNAARVELDSQLMLSLVACAQDGDVSWRLSYFPHGTVDWRNEEGYIVSASSIKTVTKHKGPYLNK